MSRTLVFITLISLPIAALAADPATASSSPQSPSYSLDEFGPIRTADDATATLNKAAAEIIAKGGGLLIIPTNAPPSWTPANISQGLWRTPGTPTPAQQWGETASVTLFDYRTGALKVLVPQLSGLELDRTFSLPEGQSAPHWEVYPMLRLKNEIIRGTTSYREWLLKDVSKGPDQRFYVATIRGVFPGMFLTTGDWGKVSRLYVKSLGFDKELGLPYFVADVDMDVHKTALIHNKNHANALWIDTISHTENQTFDLANWRHDYSQGDTYLYDARFFYMSDVHSTAGDENGVLYAAFVNAEVNGFRGQVESFDPTTSKLIFKSAANPNTLGTGRPLLDLSPQKLITNGTVQIVRPAPASPLDATSPTDGVFEGKSWPTRTITNAATNSAELRIGGLIRFSADAPVTDAAVGRYFAVDEPTECVAGTSNVRRWYQIHSIQKNPDGTKDIKIVRYWWGAKAAGSPTLYKPDNYTRDGHLKPLHYVIAPGANVYDVAEAVGPNAARRTLKVAPGPDTGAAADFAAGDPVEQAIGPDPFKPIPFRSWIWDAVPGAFPSPVFDINNQGAIQRSTVLSVRGGKGGLEESTNRADRLPPWENVIVVESAVRNGIVFAGDVANAAIYFSQPHGRAQPIKWLYANGTREATLTVSPENGTMKFDGGGIAAPGGLINLKGLSGTATAAQNLRGISIAVPTGSKELTITFPKPEADADYALFIEPSWLTTHAFARQTAEGFTLTFDPPPVKNERLHWLLVR